MRFRMRKYELARLTGMLILALTCTYVSKGQNVTNVDGRQEGKAIAITYDLKEKSDISIYTTQDGGKTKELIPETNLHGDVGKGVLPGSEKRVLWRVMEETDQQSFIAEDLSFIVSATPVHRFFSMLHFGWSFDSKFNGGFSVGQLDDVGWYFKGMCTLPSHWSYNYECDERLVNTGRAGYLKVYCIGGGMVKLFNPLYLHLGAGYGYRAVTYETTDGNWARCVPETYHAGALDAGFLFRIKKILVSGSVTLMDGNPDIHFGLGYVF